MVPKVFGIVKVRLCPCSQKKKNVYFIFQYLYLHAFLLIFITCQLAKISNMQNGI